MKWKNYKFEVVFEIEEDGRYHAYCPDLPGCHTFGRSLKEAKKYIKEAIAVYCESLAKHGESIPQPRQDKVLVGHIQILLEAA